MTGGDCRTAKRKKARRIGMIAAALAVMILLTACGGAAKDDAVQPITKDQNAEEQTGSAPVLYGGWYYAQIPDGFTAVDETEREFKGPDGKSVVIYLSATWSDVPDAAALAAEKLEDSAVYYADLTQDYCAEVTMFGLTADDPDGKALLASFKAAEGDPGDNEQAFYQEIYQ